MRRAFLAVFLVALIAGGIGVLLEVLGHGSAATTVAIFVAVVFGGSMAVLDLGGRIYRFFVKPS